ncbi:MAG: LysR family transcriptional regulator [Acidiferrobacter sp.]
MRHGTIRQLEVFDAIMRFGSFRKAADHLFLTQPTVSMQMKKLADAVGHPLFEHIGKRVFPTDIGRELHKTAREIFGDLARFDMTLASLEGLKSGSLSLAVVTTAKYFAPGLLGRFCERHPAVEASLKVCNRAHIIERLAANEDDFYILGQPPEEIEVEAEAFLDNPLVAVASKDHPLMGRARIPLRRLAEEPFLLREPGSGTRAAMERLFAEHGLKARARMELESNEAIKQAILVHFGVSILSRHTISMELASGHLGILDVEGLPIARSWYIVHRKGKALSVVARAFRDCLQEYTAKPDGLCARN